MLFQYSIGIDVKDEVLTGVLLRGSIKGVEMSAHDVRPIRMQRSSKEMHQDIVSLIERLGSEIEIGSVAVYIGVPRKAAIIRELVFPYAVKENLQETLQYELEKYVPFSFEDCYFDYQIVDQDKAENRLHVLLNVVRRDAFDSLIGPLNSSGVGLSGLEVSSSATVNALQHFRPKDQTSGYIFAKEENGGADLLFVENAHLRKSFLIGNEDRPENIQTVAKEITDVFQGKSSPEAGKTTCWMLPASAHNHRIQSLAEAAAIQFETVEWVSPGVTNDALLSAYGLALKGVKHVPMQINMLPKDQRKPIGRRSVYLMFFLAALLILSGVSWMGSQLLHKKVTMNRLHEEIEALKPAAIQISKVETEMTELDSWLSQLRDITGKDVGFFGHSERIE